MTIVLTLLVTTEQRSPVLVTLMTVVVLQSGELRSVVAEGLAKLLMSGRLFSAALLSRLLLLWYNPLAEDDARLRHTLGTFFPIFAFTDRWVIH